MQGFLQPPFATHCSRDLGSNIHWPLARLHLPGGESRGARNGSVPEAVVTSSEVWAIYSELKMNWDHCVGLYAHGPTIYILKRFAKDLDLIAVVDKPKREFRVDTPDSQLALGRVVLLTQERLS